MADDTKAPAQTPLAQAAERIRGSAQWLIGAFGAVGVLLAAGLQIAEIGQLTTDDKARFWAAFGGIAFAAFGVVVAISAAAGVSTKTDVSLRWLLAHPDSEAAKEVNASVALRQGHQLTELADGIDKAATEAAARYRDYVAIDSTTPEDEAASIEAASAQATAELDRLTGIRRGVIDVASFYRVKSAFDRAKWVMGFGAFAAAVGITAFAWGANPPKTTTLNGGDVLPKTPSNVTVILTKKGIKRYGGPLSKNKHCDLSNLPAIAFTVSNTTYDVVTLATKNCRARQMRVTALRGQVIPRVN